MSEQETTNTTEAQKTVIAFIAGLLIGGLLVWIFGGTPEDSETRVSVNDDDSSEVEDMDTDDDADDDDVVASNDDEDTSANDDTSMQTGDGSLTVNDQSAGTTVAIEGAVFPTDEGWIAVRDYQNGQLGSILGAARYSREQGLIPEEVTLLRSTQAGTQYAVVFYRENGDRDFSVATDAMISGIMEPFTAR